MARPILRVTIEDLELGDHEEAQVVAGDYVIVCAKPLELTHVQAFANGTRILTLKRGAPDRSQAWRYQENQPDG